jgi:formyltetrahydrofolate hydrolase
MQPTVTLLFSCPDRRGLVAKVANFVYSNGGNLACTYALQGNTNQAIDYLQQLIQNEPDKYIDLARKDDDFHSLHNDPQFIDLIR